MRFGIMTPVVFQPPGQANPWEAHGDVKDIAAIARAGFAQSDLGQRILDRVPLHRTGNPDEISWGILFLLSPLASYVNGILLTADGGWTITQ